MTGRDQSECPCLHPLYSLNRLLGSASTGLAPSELRRRLITTLLLNFPPLSERKLRQGMREIPQLCARRRRHHSRRRSGGE